MIWACFTGDRLGPLIVFEEGGVGADEYMEVSMMDYFHWLMIYWKCQKDRK